MTCIEQARKLRPIIEQAAESLDDKSASESVALFSHLKEDGSLIKAGKRINWRGVLKQAAVDLWDTETNSPDAAPALWSDIAYREGIRVIPNPITATTAFALNELGWQEGHIYRSGMEGNTHQPGDLNAPWTMVR